jgi:hypothetical protein
MELHDPARATDQIARLIPDRYLEWDRFVCPLAVSCSVGRPLAFGADDGEVGALNVVHPQLDPAGVAEIELGQISVPNQVPGRAYMSASSVMNRLSGWACRAMMGERFAAVTFGIWKLRTAPPRRTKEKTDCLGGIGSYARFLAFPPMKVSSASTVDPSPPSFPPNGQLGSFMHSRMRCPMNQAVFLRQLRVRWICRVGKPFLELHITYMTCNQMCIGAWLDSKTVPIRTVNSYRQA